MAPHWVSLSFQGRSVAFGCRGLRSGLFVSFLGSSTIFVPAGLTILNECGCFIPQISNFSSKFCNINCLTLHLPRAVVCRPRQTSVDVHFLVVIIQGYCFSNMPFQETEQKLLPKKSFCQLSRFPWISHQQWVLALQKY